MRTRKICKIENCVNPTCAFGFCQKHYTRWKRHGDPNIIKENWHKSSDKICSIPECNEKHCAKGYCYLHYRRFLQHGDPRKRLTNIGFTITGKGYKLLTINGKTIPEHRHFMEQKLNRKLKPNEDVHHINGDKLDNRLSNLIVMTHNKHTFVHKEKYKRKRLFDKIPCLVCGKPSKARSLCSRHHGAWLQGLSTFPENIIVPPKQKYKPML